MKKCILILLLLSHGLYADESVSSWSSTIVDVLQTVNSEAYFPVSFKPALIKALDAYVQQIDENSQFLGPDDYKELKNTTSGTYYGIGVELAPKKDDDDFLLILHVKPGSPAEKEGLIRYDKIVAIEGVSVSTLTLQESIQKLKSETRYAPLELSVMRAGKTFTITIKRDRIPEETCWGCTLAQQSILYCTIASFSHRTADQLEKILLKGISKKTKGMILDLRDNVGGVLNGAIECGGLFLPTDSLVVSTKDRSGKLLEQLRTTRFPVAKDIPLVMLVNNYTASAAEILVQALKVHAKKGHFKKTLSPHIFIIGTKTYGKGSVQEVKPIGNDCALKLTTALYYLPDNSSIQNKGITPDFIVKQKYPQQEDLKNLEKIHIKEHQKNKRHKAKSNDSQSRMLSAVKKDYQLQCACNLVLLTALAQETCPQEVSSHDKALTWLQRQFVIPSSLEPNIL